MSHTIDVLRLIYIEKVLLSNLREGLHAYWI